MSKRLLLANVLQKLGFGILNRHLHRHAVLIFNYHRIRNDGAAAPSRFDEGVFGPTQSEFRTQLACLQKHTIILNESDLIRGLDGGEERQRLCSLITFDDAYSDNYHLALPVLAEMGIPAIFFVPFASIENRELGWWDQIAFIVKNSKKNELRFRGKTFLLHTDRQVPIAHLLSLMKLTPATETESLVAELAEAADSPPPDSGLMDKELMSWDQLQAAYKAGVALGSHTCSHRVLATLSEAQQREELVTSKALLEKRINVPVRSVAYPVGGLAHFTAATCALAEQAGYQAGFSFNTGFGCWGQLNRFAIPRMAAPASAPLLQAAVSFPKLMDYTGTM